MKKSAENTDVSTRPEGRLQCVSFLQQTPTQIQWIISRQCERSVRTRVTRRERRRNVGVAIHNEVNQNDRPVGISFRRRDQLSGDVIWSVFEVSQLNSRSNAVDTFTVVVYSFRMPVGFGFRGDGIKTKVDRFR